MLLVSLLVCHKYNFETISQANNVSCQAQHVITSSSCTNSSSTATAAVSIGIRLPLPADVDANELGCSGATNDPSSSRTNGHTRRLESKRSNSGLWPVPVSATNVAPAEYLTAVDCTKSNGRPACRGSANAYAIAMATSASPGAATPVTTSTTAHQANDEPE